MEENITDTDHPDKDAALELIKRKKSDCAAKIYKPEITGEMIAEHVKRNTEDGVYPFTKNMIIEEGREWN